MLHPPCPNSQALLSRMERRENGKKEDKRERRGDAATPIWFTHLHVTSSLSVLPATVRPFQPTFWARLKQAAEEAWVHYPLPIEKREKKSLSTIVLGRGGGFTLTITKATEKRKMTYCNICIPWGSTSTSRTWLFRSNQTLPMTCTCRSLIHAPHPCTL